MVVKEFQYEMDLTVVICFDKEKMLEKGELALEEALRSKTAVMIADDIIEDVHRTIGDNLIWLKKIKESIQDERLMPFYQPIANSSNGKVEKYESLVRMIEKDGNIVPPGKFLFIAKKSKYYHDITKIMLKKTMEKFTGRSEGVSVNLSAMDIEDNAMRDFIVQSLELFPEAASRLTFEIVEQEGFKFFDILKEFIKQVKQYGVKIAIDDFGSGYSNFRTLIDMDVDFLKVDGSLIKNIHTDISSRNVVDTIKTFAEKTSMEIIAEFVENEEIFNCLKNMGIHYCQGYYIGKPELL
jgi:EAL domain-containing protein (putative c-di-GMP-specific phosphodiesterase class I)